VVRYHARADSAPPLVPRSAMADILSAKEISKPDIPYMKWRRVKPLENKVGAFRRGLALLTLPESPATGPNQPVPVPPPKSYFAHFWLALGKEIANLWII
jgi:hypothetical protein